MYAFEERVVVITRHQAWAQFVCRWMPAVTGRAFQIERDGDRFAVISAARECQRGDRKLARALLVQARVQEEVARGRAGRARLQ